MKRKILSFTNKISRHLSKPGKKFTADITYGILFSRSCLMTDIADQFHEPSKKINVVDRLSRHLEKGTPASAAASYLHQVVKWVPAEPVIHIDDSDVMEVMEMTLDELKQVIIDYYVNLQRIKKLTQGTTQI